MPYIDEPETYLNSLPHVLNKRIDGEPRNSVYVGRPSKWGNPFVIGTRENLIKKFEQYLRNDSRLMEAVKRELRGKNLVCWCAPKPCHADVLLRIANA